MSEHTTAAVEFDVAAFRAWVDTTETMTGSRPIGETDPYLSSGYDHIDGDAGWLAAGVLLNVRNAENAGWRMADGTDVRVYVLADAEGGDDGVLVEVLEGGQWLSAGHLNPRALVPVDEDQRLPGYEAAILALESVATAVNERVEHFRTQLYGFYARQLTRHEIEAALVTLAEYHDGNPGLSPLQKEVAAKVAALTSDEPDGEVGPDHPAHPIHN